MESMLEERNLYWPAVSEPTLPIITGQRHRPPPGLLPMQEATYAQI